MTGLRVIKYGGSVLKDAKSYGAAARYQIERGPLALVSAANGVTELLMSIFDRRAVNELPGLGNTYSEIAKPLPPLLYEATINKITREMERLAEYLRIGARDAFVGSGEGHSAILLTSHINALGRNAAYLMGPDAGFFLNDHGLVEMEPSREPLKRTGELCKENIVVVGGYLGKQQNPEQHKVGTRNVNDAFVVALADALDADAVEIVKDVPGVFRVPPEFGDYGLLERLSYDEERKMSWRGSPVVHPVAVRMAQTAGKPVIVKDLKSEGTTISSISETNNEKPFAALVAEETYLVSVLDDILDTQERGKYLLRLFEFENEIGTNTTVTTADVDQVSYNIAPPDRKMPRDATKIWLENHNEKIIECLNSYGYHPTVRGREVGMITVVGDKMQGRQGTLAYLADIFRKHGESIQLAVHGHEGFSPPSITFAVDRNKLGSIVKVMADELFNDR